MRGNIFAYHHDHEEVLRRQIHQPVTNCQNCSSSHTIVGECSKRVHDSRQIQSTENFDLRGVFS